MDTQMAHDKNQQDQQVHTQIPMIEYRNVSKEYDEGSGVLAIENLSLSIDPGEFVMLVGSSGGGKTTLMKMVNRLVEPTQGEVLINGKNVKEFDLISLRRSIGYSIQGSVLFPHMSVAKNISYVMRLEKADKAEIKQRVLQLIEMVDLDPSFLKKYSDELSGGQAQRVGIARALANKPKILLMDEPFGAVDMITRSSLQHEIKRIHDLTNITVLFVTHDINEAMTLGTKVAVIDSGVLQQFDTPDVVKHYPATPYVERLVRDIS